MEWLSCIRKTIDIIEKNINGLVDVKEISKELCISQFFLQKGFAIMTGYSIGKYLTNRKLYSAAIDIQNSDRKIIDIALDYGYETPESFTKAFTRFHNATPTQVRQGAAIHTFLPLKINISISGGDTMDVKIMKIDTFTVIGYKKEISCDNGFEEIPFFWDEVFSEENKSIYDAEFIKENAIGEYGICIDDYHKEGKTLYMIAGKYNGTYIPESAFKYEIPGGDWAVFDCYGPMPKSIQDVTTKIFKEWLPANPDYELRENITVEWYDDADMNDRNYHSAVWLPVKPKK